MILHLLHLRESQLPLNLHQQQQYDNINGVQGRYYVQGVQGFSGVSGVLGVSSHSDHLVGKKKDQRIGKRIFSEIDPFGEEIWYDD